MKGILELEPDIGSMVDATEFENLVLVDCLNLAFRYKRGAGGPFKAKYLRTIQSLAKSYEGKHVVLLADKKHSSFRKELWPEYKGGREELKAKQTPEEAEEFRLFFEEYTEALELCKEQFPLIQLLFVEADDLAAYIVKRYSPNYKHTWLISSDKDWDLLLSENVSRFSFVTRQEYDLDNFYDHKGCDNPEQYISIKVIEGEGAGSGDNIPGIPNWGTKRAYNLIREYGSALDVYDALPLPSKGKLAEYLEEYKERIPLNYQLMDLLSFCEDAILHPDPNNLKIIDEVMNGLNH